MGPSGAGKTTLLDVIAGRKTQGQMTGELVFGDKAPSRAFLKRHTGYVEQFDTLVRSLLWSLLFVSLPSALARSPPDRLLLRADRIGRCPHCGGVPALHRGAQAPARGAL